MDHPKSDRRELQRTVDLKARWDPFLLERPSRVSYYLARHVFFPEAWPARPWSDAPFLWLRPCLSWRRQWTICVNWKIFRF
jgi:hypothetical protein